MSKSRLGFNFRGFILAIIQKIQGILAKCENKMKRNDVIVLLLLVLTSFAQRTGAQELMFRGGHSHNDYHQQHPLTDALKNGMVSVEADVFLVGNNILVGHSESELTDDRTLENLYLQPLWKKLKKERRKFSPIILLVDIKTNGGIFC